ncbi:hypothetical protein DPMN_142579 [Dreissena polymorpha]|uniref:Uncharacterized protein n=1 Tax=Dreissena polymorpha TaxID=45954 RepID=A0A9D4GET7_DREPO|nr:hypothetical protein DPMN_142579 [Dreissena polymorpha]
MLAFKNAHVCLIAVVERLARDPVPIGGGTLGASFCAEVHRLDVRDGDVTLRLQRLSRVGDVIVDVGAYEFKNIIRLINRIMNLYSTQ